MQRIYEVTAGRGGNAHLLIGDEKTAVIDTGMCFFGDKLVENIEKILGDRELDYIFLTHSHYDHVGGVPYLRRRYKNVCLVAAEHAAYILAKDSAYKLICDLTANAKNVFNDGSSMEVFPKSDYAVDRIVKEGEEIDLGGFKVVVYETPGHTKCSISFYLKGLDTLFPSETTGVATKTSFVFPSYIISSEKACEALRKLRALNAKHIIPPHSVMQDEYRSAHFFDESMFSISLTRRLITGLYLQGLSVDKILDEYEHIFADKVNTENQPRWAFRINTEAQIKTVIREYEEKVFDLENDTLF